MSGRRFSPMDKVVAKLAADARKGVHRDRLQVTPEFFRQLCPGLDTATDTFHVVGPHGPVRIEPHPNAAELTVVAGSIIAKICHCLDGHGDAHVHLDGGR